MLATGQADGEVQPDSFNRSLTTSDKNSSKPLTYSSVLESGNHSHDLSAALELFFGTTASEYIAEDRRGENE